MLTRRSYSVLPIAAVFLSLAAGCGEPVKVPTSYAKWAPEGDTIFHIDYPEGWNADGAGKNQTQWATFKKGGCLIDCKTNVSSSLIGDISQSMNQMGGGGDALSPEEMEERSPAAAAHAWNMKNSPPDAYGSYKEEPKAIAFQSGLGDARKSIFTGTMMGRSVKGYRASFLTKDRGVIVFCHCSAKDFEKMKPAFDKVLESVRRGG